MKLLYDQNLSRHLVRQLAVEYPESQHVTDVDLDTATDAEIWSWAGKHSFVIVSKDSDLRQLAFLHGPPAEGDLAADGQRLDPGHLQRPARSRRGGRTLRGHRGEALLALPSA